MYVPFIMETGGYINRRVHLFLDTVLVRTQAYMLADIVVAIPAVDLAVEAVV